MATARRRFLVAALAVPAVVLGARAIPAVRGAIAASRPRSIGRSAALCGACGAPTHTMLDPACPATPRVV